ncbi:MAG: hypothetical protein Q7S40_29455 [Opitutaceae bacterium]|nr:hypothetical protein [Opitutaceae bacterium]
MKPKFLNRYTTLPILIDMLWRKQITLLSPNSWEDRNDAHYLERYQEEKELGSVLALCFSTKRETFHHWRVFSHGSGGVCIEFDAEEFLAGLRGKPEFRFGPVEYSRIDEIERTPPKVERWPFLKRLPFADEAEFRVICESPTVAELSRPLDFDIESVKRVTLGPWMPQPVAESVTALIETIEDCSGIYVHRSSLIENGRWKKAIKGPTRRRIRR